MNLLSEKSIYQEVIESPEFERLKDISFLGVVDHFYRNRKKYTTRYEHSISVANLCLIYSDKKNLPEIEENYIVLAGLLHDLGHCCFSHSLEPVFKRRFSITHHIMTRKLISSSSNLLEIWDKYDINPIRIIDAIEGRSNQRDKIVAKMCFNFDTLDGIVRTESHFADSSSIEKIMNQIFDVLCSDENFKGYLGIFDLFWKEKERIYSSYIYKERHRYYELLFQNLFMNDDSLSNEHFLLSDSQMLSKFRWVKLFIEDLKDNDTYDLFFNDLRRDNYCNNIFESEIRRFTISSTGDFSLHNNNRYLVSKETSKVKNLDNYALPIFQ